MNAMRRLLSGTSGQGGQFMNSSPSELNDEDLKLASSQSQHAALSLMHLRKLFGDFANCCQTITDEERNGKLYSMLPLFCRVRILFVIFLIYSDSSWQVTVSKE